MKVHVKTETGRRKNNEDSYYISPDQELLILADGMGGHAAGEEASRMATDLIKNYLSKEDLKGPDKIKKALKKAVLEANRTIYQRAQADPDLKGMGTTLSLVYFYEEDLYYLNIGDSRIYILGHKDLFQLSKDDSFVNYLVEIGDITRQEARVHPQKNILTKALGSFEDLEVEVDRFDGKKVRKLLLCTDGLSDVLEEEAIYKILVSDKTLEERTDMLVKKALDLGSRDNITVIVMDRE
ncbi:MAG: Stp1/IreP family PP2C-type Ser/Thr phosphatase [Tissierellia bacterium]|nr:Stp1/IreP family PP2C-type Ser/Thr phosphatase [Tissierellia bacterium]